MTTVERILVATGLDRRDQTSIRHAARLAQAFHSQSVMLAHIATPSEESAQASAARPLEHEGEPPAELRLKQLADAQRGEFPTATQLTTVTRRGARVPELLRLASEQSTDLIVVGRRPRDEHDAVSDAIVKLEWKSPCSLLVVPEGVPSDYQRILVACDFSDHSLDALQTAIQIAREQPQSSITIQHVVSLPTTTIMAGRSVAQFAAILRDEARRVWNAFAEKLAWDGVRHELRIDESDRVPDAINQAAAQLDAHVIVVGSHGLSQAAGALLGHVADAVCSRATRPFLCVKRKGEVVSLLQSLLSLYQTGSERPIQTSAAARLRSSATKSSN